MKYVFTDLDRRRSFITKRGGIFLNAKDIVNLIKGSYEIIDYPLLSDDDKAVKFTSEIKIDLRGILPRYRRTITIDVWYRNPMNVKIPIDISGPNTWSYNVYSVGSSSSVRRFTATLERSPSQGHIVLEPTTSDGAYLHFLGIYDPEFTESITWTIYPEKEFSGTETIMYDFNVPLRHMGIEKRDDVVYVFRDEIRFRAVEDSEIALVMRTPCGDIEVHTVSASVGETRDVRMDIPVIFSEKNMYVMWKLKYGRAYVELLDLEGMGLFPLSTFRSSALLPYVSEGSISGSAGDKLTLYSAQCKRFIRVGTLELSTDSSASINVLINGFVAFSVAPNSSVVVDLRDVWRIQVEFVVGGTVTYKINGLSPAFCVVVSY